MDVILVLFDVFPVDLLERVHKIASDLFGGLAHLTSLLLALPLLRLSLLLHELRHASVFLLVLSYPVGKPDSFESQTKEVAEVESEDQHSHRDRGPSHQELSLRVQVICREEQGVAQDHQQSFVRHLQPVEQLLSVRLHPPDVDEVERLQKDESLNLEVVVVFEA